MDRIYFLRRLSTGMRALCPTERCLGSRYLKILEGVGRMSSVKCGGSFVCCHGYAAGKWDLGPMKRYIVVLLSRFLGKLWQDELLRQGVSLYKTAYKGEAVSWVKVSEHMDNRRSPPQCAARWQILCRESEVTVPI